MTVEVPGLTGGGATVHLGLARLVGLAVTQPVLELDFPFVLPGTTPLPSFFDADHRAEGGAGRGGEGGRSGFGLAEGGDEGVVQADPVSPTKKLGPLVPVAPAPIAAPTSSPALSG